ncbi:MAG: hypothetical protein LUE26_04195 [Alistipes sp.]|nr:hypothetical protein [Alistipes sp.]
MMPGNGVRDRLGITAVIVLPVVVIAGLIHYGRYGKVPFDRDVWQQTGQVDRYFIPSERYGMAMWLKDNYDFRGKTPDEVYRMLGSAREVETGAGTVRVQYPIRQRDPNFIIGIDPPVDVALLVIYFRDGAAVRAVIEKRKGRGTPFRETAVIFE